MRALAAATALALTLLWNPAVAAPAAPPARDITLVDQTGAHFRLADLRGRPIVVSFIATRCTDTCPLTEALFSRLSRTDLNARLVTITLDPDYDTPFVMARHALDLHAQPTRWRVASGTPHDIVRILAAFGVVREYDTDGIPDAHSTFIYIFDGAGRLIRALPLSSNSVAEVRAAVADAAPSPRNAALSGSRAGSRG
jgi:protein SCO1